MLSIRFLKKQKQFIEDTGIDTFAVAIGTAHGIYPKDMKPELRIGILKEGHSSRVAVYLWYYMADPAKR